MKQKTSAAEAKFVVNELGGQQAVASVFGLTQQAVSLWTKKGLPKPWRALLASLHPDLFGTDARATDSAETS
jgi:hypothetical protein